MGHLLGKDGDIGDLEEDTDVQDVMPTTRLKEDRNEISRTSKKMKMVKAAGHDEITLELYDYMGSEGESSS